MKPDLEEYISRAAALYFYPPPHIFLPPRILPLPPTQKNRAHPYLERVGALFYLSSIGRCARRHFAISA